MAPAPPVFAVLVTQSANPTIVALGALSSDGVERTISATEVVVKDFLGLFGSSSRAAASV
jgi:hypothetical protein